jgi:hypothetical protein
MNLAFQCSCHISPPCRNCECGCANCQGTGVMAVYRNASGAIDYIEGAPTNETAECPYCEGEGTFA